MRIHEYSYKPEPLIFARVAEDLPYTQDGSLFLGVELEVFIPNGRRDVNARLDALPWPLCHRTDPSPNTLFYAKRDSSINGNGQSGQGVELVSHPFAYHVYMRRYREELTTLLLAIQADGIQTNTSTGMHVHVSRKAFVNTSHTYNFLNLFYRYPKFTYRLSGRANNNLVDTWAKLDVRGEDRLVEKAERTQDSDRRTAVNMTTNTAEIRIFGATLDPVQFHARVQVAFAAVRYAQECNNAAHAVPLRWRLWVREHAEEYPELAQFFAGWQEEDDHWLQKNPSAFPALAALLA